VALLHVDRADSRGVCQIAGPDIYMEDLFARAATNTFGIKGVRENCLFLKQIEDAANLRKVEERIETDALGLVRRRCNAERLSKQKMVDAANGHPGAERARMLEAADRIEMPWCDEKDVLEAAKAR
jgi:hypothetical protein